MTIQQAIREWNSKRRRMGCVAAADWFCKRVSGFKPKRLERYTISGEYYEHVVATDGNIIIDLAPYSDKPKYDYPWQERQDKALRDMRINQSINRKLEEMGLGFKIEPTDRSD